MKLYFIALVPEKDLEKKLQVIKEDFAEKYNSRHALKLQPHITLIPPFKFLEEKEVLLIKQLEDLGKKEHHFTIELSGYGSFKPRVIFIDTKNKTPIIELSFRVKKALKDLHTEISEKREEIHPHITIATRDLSREAFKNAWIQYKNKFFEDNFEVKNFVLFRHNGKQWEKLQNNFYFNIENPKD